MQSLVRTSVTVLVLGSVAGCAATPATTQQPAPMAAVDTVLLVDTVVAGAAVAPEMLQAGRFDNGKMWTFEYPPMEYFRETYAFAPDSAWFADARLSALRLPNCTASFVSADGLVLTNHHCGRASVSQVTRTGEHLLDEGFYAPTNADERPVDGLYVDQLVAMVDVTEELDAAPPGQRDAVGEQIAERVAAEYGGTGMHVELVSLWNGARTKAYVFNRFTDLRLVFAPELQLGFFGGDADNFTYPRYALDVSFFRVYVDGQPYHPDHYFPWTATGVEQGDAVFVIGNPGSTARLETVAQLAFRRDVRERAILDLYTSRIDALEAYSAEAPERAEALGLRNRIASLANGEKLYRGRNAALQDPIVMGRRADTERRFREAVERDPALRERYGDLWDRMADVERRKIALGKDYGAFVGFTSSALSAAATRRGFLAFRYLGMRAPGSEAQRARLSQRIRAIGEQPAGLQVRLLASRLQDLERYLGDTSQVVRAILRDQTPLEAARLVIDQSVLTDSTQCATALDEQVLTMEDPAVHLIGTLAERYGAYQRAFGALLQEEEDVARLIGRAWFDVYGTREPPDATFSLRMADGVVEGYAYNGTVAPVYTTFHGLYDHYYSYGAGTEWNLPTRWLNPPASFDRSTPLNFVATLDIIGGNSGSPVINTDLEFVGVAFDGNIESLSGDYIYLPTANRAVSVDARGILEALEDIYQAQRLVTELRARRPAR